MICYGNFPDSINGSDLDVWLGPGFICVLVATLLKVFDIFVHLLVPVPKEGSWEPGVTSEAEADSKQKEVNV